MRTIILLSHASRRNRLVTLMRKHAPVFEEYRLLSTTELGEFLEEKTGFEVSHVFPAAKGGDIQLCGLVCTNSIGAVIFLNDPHCVDPAEPRLDQFIRACDLNNVPLATNIVTAHALTTWLGRKIEEGDPDPAQSRENEASPEAALQ